MNSLSLETLTQRSFLQMSTLLLTFNETSCLYWTQYYFMHSAANLSEASACSQAFLQFQVMSFKAGYLKAYWTSGAICKCHLCSVKNGYRPVNSCAALLYVNPATDNSLAQLSGQYLENISRYSSNDWFACSVQPLVQEWYAMDIEDYTPKH